MRLDTFRLSRLAAFCFLLLCIPGFGRCESLNGVLESGADADVDIGVNIDIGVDSNNEKVVDAKDETGDGNESGNSGSDDEEDDEEDTEEDLYFYLFDDESVVTEYRPPSDEEAKDEPDFLYHPKPGHIRIVEFYAHWCPHCADFRPKYNAFAKKMMELAEREKLNLDIYAVSCVPHRPLCRDQDINGYPRIRLYIGDDVTKDEFIDIDTEILHPFFILQTISKKTGTDAYTDFALMGEKEEQQYNHDEENNELSAPGLGSDSFWIHRTKYDIYCDAYLSFHFAMEHGIFVGRDPPDKKAKQAFADWIFLLNEVLPPSWPLQAMLSDIVGNIETVLDSEENLLKIVHKYPPPRKKWSRSCSRGDSSMGYTCGLWELFHITSVGVVESNLNNVAGIEDLFYRPGDVGEILRSYVDHFFGCEVCRTNFLHDYDNCEFGRCERFTTDIGALEDWKELPLWLFEVHNGVNARLMRERAERDSRKPTQQELTAAEWITATEWPSRKDCPSCWHGDGRFDLDAVYSFLQLTYWPGELVAATGNADEVHKNEDQEGIESWVFSLVGLVLVSSVFTIVLWRAQKQREIERTGKHKKNEDDNYV